MLLVFQVNGGEVPEKVDYAYSLFESAVRINGVFSPNEMIDTIAVTKGRGREGVVTRWGVTRLPRKTHRGLRKVRQSGLVAFNTRGSAVWYHIQYLWNCMAILICFLLVIERLFQVCEKQSRCGDRQWAVTSF